MQDNGNKIVRQSGLWRTERPAGSVPVRTPSLAPDAPAQTRRRGTLRVSVGLSGNQSQRFQQLSFLHHDLPSGKTMAFQPFPFGLKTFQARARSFTHAVPILGIFWPLGVSPQSELAAVLAGCE